MQKGFYIIILGILTLSINSCCTKEYCEPIINAPSIYYVFSDYGYYDLDEVKYFRLAASNYSVIDSLKNSEHNDKTLTLIGNYKSLYSNKDIIEHKNYNYVIPLTV